MGLAPVWRLRSEGERPETPVDVALSGERAVEASLSSDDAPARPSAVRAVPVSEAPSALAPSMPVEEDARRQAILKMGWAELKDAVAPCTACPLHARRTRTVFGVGDERARWLFVGEGPGAEEDAKGEPFVGQA